MKALKKPVTVKSLVLDLLKPNGGTIQFEAPDKFSTGTVYCKDSHFKWRLRKDENGKIFLHLDGENCGIVKSKKDVLDKLLEYSAIQRTKNTKDKTYIVLVWSIIPEATEIYLIPKKLPITKTVIASSGQYINDYALPEDAPVYTLSDWITENQAYKSESCHISGHEISDVVVAGFYNM